MKIRQFTFNPFQENTYIVYDETGECIIIDPGFSNEQEEEEFMSFIEHTGLKPMRLLNTHCHIDHILGNKGVMEKYGLELEAHQLEITNVMRAAQMAAMYGFHLPEPPSPTRFLNEHDVINFGNSSLEVIFTPGHAAGHVVFYNKEDKSLIGGDVLFKESIGRTDLPGGSFSTLYKSITEKLFQLPDETIVYPGHGESTTIGHEKKHNPFLNDVLI